MTCEWWDSLWLNEGFAEFLVFFGVDAVEPGMRIWDSYYRIEMDATMQSDGRTSSHPIIQVTISLNKMQKNTVPMRQGFPKTQVAPENSRKYSIFSVSQKLCSNNIGILDFFSIFPRTLSTPPTPTSATSPTSRAPPSTASWPLW